jgi:hypothetical protein
MNAKLVRFAAASVAIALAAPAFGAEHWGKFRYDGCTRYKDGNYRVYKSVLWGIPWGQSWEVACSKAPATIVVGGKKVHFRSPTVCVKASVVDALSIAGAALGVAGVVFPPAGAVGAVVGVGTVVADKAGVGALNMWGVFYVQVPKC